MKSVTIHKLDDEIAHAIQDIVEKTGMSQNKIVKKLLRKALNLSESQTPKTDFSAFCGIWDKKETKAFNDAISVFGKVDKEIWE